MTIVVCVKHVPDAQSERAFRPGDHTTDREGVDGLLCELDEYAVEAALTLAEASGAEVTALTMGPAGAGDALRRALQMGAHRGVHVQDPALHGSCAMATSLVLARAVERIRDEQGVELVLTGMASTDGATSVVPAMVAERLALPYLGFASELTVQGELAEGMVRIRRDGDASTELVEAPPPAVVSVTDQINEPRYPSFKGIMAAKKKPVATWSLADLGVDPTAVGLAAATTVVESVTPRPPREAGTVVTDDGDGGVRLARFLIESKLV